jgi:hypothetical protein
LNGTLQQVNTFLDGDGQDMSLIQEVIDGMGSVNESVKHVSAQQKQHPRFVYQFFSNLERDVYKNIKDTDYYTQLYTLCSRLEKCKAQLEQLNCYGVNGSDVIDSFEHHVYSPIMQLKESLNMFGKDEAPCVEKFKVSIAYLLSLTHDTFNDTRRYINDRLSMPIEHTHGTIRKMLQDIRSEFISDHHFAINDSCYINDAETNETVEVKLFVHLGEDDNIVIYYKEADTY